MPGPLTLGQIASRLGGRVAGDAHTLIRQVGSLEHAGPGEITFLTKTRLNAKLGDTRAAAVILAPEHESVTALPRIVCDNPYAYFARVSQLFNPLTTQAGGVHPSAVVSPTAKLGKDVSIGAGCEIGANTTIDRGALDDTVIEDGVKLDNQVQVAHNVRIGAHSAVAGCVGIA